MTAAGRLVGREVQMDSVRAALAAAAAGKGALIVVSGPAGIGKTRLLEEALEEAQSRGFGTAVGTSLPESMLLYQPWSEALRDLRLDHLLHSEIPPRLLALYLVAQSGAPIARVERPDFSEDPALLSMMLKNAAEFIRDAIRPHAPKSRGDLLRMSVGDRGVIAFLSEGAALLCVVEGRESEIFVSDAQALFDSLLERAGDRLQEWDGNRQTFEDLVAPMSRLLESGKYEGVELSQDGVTRKFNVFDNVLYGLRRKSSGQPLLVVLDDLQWADPSSLGLLHYLSRNARGDRIVVMASYRTEDEAAREHLANALVGIRREDLATEMPLSPFAAPQLLQLAQSFVGPLEVPDDFVAQLSTTTEGNPLFVRESLLELLEAGVLARDAQANVLRLKAGADWKHVPIKVRDVVASRLRRLGREDRDVIDAAAVCGTRFKAELVAKVLVEDDVRIERGLNALSRAHGLVRSEGPLWSFDHSVVREVVYASLSEDLRSRYHLRAAAALELSAGELWEIGEHLFHARDPRAVEPLLSAGNAAMARGAPEEAARLKTEALSLITDERQARVMAEVGDAQYEAGRLEVALGWFERAIETTGRPEEKVEAAARGAKALERMGKLDEALEALRRTAPAANAPPAIRAPWLSSKAWVEYRKLRFKEAEADARQALEAFGLAGNPPAEVADCWNTMGSINYREGRIEEASRCFSKGLEAADKGSATYQSARLRLSLAQCEKSMGNLRRGLALAGEARAVAEKGGNRLFIASSLTVEAACQFCLGQTAEGKRAALSAARRFEEIGAVVRAAEPICIGALCDLEEGRAGDAEAQARRAAAIAGEGDYGISIRLNLAEILVSRGNLREAQALAERALRECKAGGITGHVVYAQCVLAIAQALEGRRAEADQSFSQALDPSLEGTDPWMHAQGMRWWGEMKLDAGESGEGRKLMEGARWRFERMGAQRELKKVQHALERKALKK